jgi:hypothetical protein
MDESGSEVEHVQEFKVQEFNGKLELVPIVPAVPAVPNVHEFKAGTRARSNGSTGSPRKDFRVAESQKGDQLPHAHFERSERNCAVGKSSERERLKRTA